MVAHPRRRTYRVCRVAMDGHDDQFHGRGPRGVQQPRNPQVDRRHGGQGAQVVQQPQDPPHQPQQQGAQEIPIEIDDDVQEVIPEAQAPPVVREETVCGGNVVWAVPPKTFK